jgi:hypothetical protein
VCAVCSHCSLRTQVSVNPSPPLRNYCPWLSLLAVWYLLLTVTLLETDIRLDRNGYNGS